MKRILSCILAILTLTALLCFQVAAREESEVVTIHNCDSVFGNTAIEKGEFVEGKSSLRLPLTGGSFAHSTTFRSVDVSKTDAIALDVYVEDADMMAHFTELYVEVSSAGTCDQEELQWNALHAIREALQKEGEGWVTIYMLNGSATNTEIDLTDVDYLRIYAFYDGNALNGKSLLVDNIRMCYIGGEDFSDLNLDAYANENPDAEVEIDGQTEPDLENRDEAITLSQGVATAKPDAPEQPKEDEGDATQTPEEPSGSNTLLITVPMIVIFIGVITIVIVLVTRKKDKKKE